MGTVCITGSAGGIGAATRTVLEDAGHRVIGVDLHDAEVEADLSSPEGRASAVAGVGAACGGLLDGLVVGAGVQGLDAPLVVSINYFGAVATLQGLRPLLALASSPSAVVISSNSATTMADIDDAAVDACLAGDEGRARTLLEQRGGFTAYPTSKLALARWCRLAAPSAEWIGSGIRLNVVAPGPTATAMTDPIRDWVLTLGETYPVPAQRIAEPWEIASVIGFLLGPGSAYVVGAFLPVDGGGEAAARGFEWPSGRS